MIKKTKNAKIIKEKVKRPTRKKLISSLDKLCSSLCCKNAEGLCEVCSKVGTQTHHMFSKGAFPAIRFEIDNLIWLCFFCHIRRIHQQGQYELARDALIKRMGEDGFSALKEKAYKKYSGLKKTTLNDLIDLEKYLKSI